MVNEEIIGGLVSALSRGDSLQKGMMSFYNAGYNKDEIEDAAREVYRQLGPGILKGESSLQKTFDTVAVEAGVVKKTPPKEEQKQNESQKDYQNKIELQKTDGKKTSDKEKLDKEKEKENKVPQNVSSYGQRYGGSYKDSDEITNKIMTAIKGLKPVNIPSRIEIVNKNVDMKTPTVIQKASDYSGGPPKSASKVLTYLLIFVLIFLLGALAAVFFFREELIKVFNNLGLG